MLQYVYVNNYSSIMNSSDKHNSWHQKAKSLYLSLFSNFKGYSEFTWGPKEEKELRKMERLQEEAKKTIPKADYDEIALFTKKARALKEGYGHVSQLQTLYKKVVVGLKQDPKFVRLPEFYHSIDLVGDNMKELQLRSKKVYSAANEFFTKCISSLKTVQEQAQFDVYQMRIERAEDLLYSCNRSNPSDQYEYKKKMDALTSVYEEYMIPMQEKEMTDELHSALRVVLENYTTTIDSLKKNKFD